MKQLLKYPLFTAFVVAFGLSACESPTAVENVDETVTSESIQYENSEMTAMLTSELSLTSVNESEVRASLVSVNRVDRQPGWEWKLAARLQSFLTDEQKARLFKLTEKFEEHEVFGLVCFVGPGGLTGPDWRYKPDFIGRMHVLRLIRDLLTREQIEQIHAIQARYRDAVRGLIRSVKAGEITREEFRSQLDELITAVIAEIRQLLTDDQVQALEERLAELTQKYQDLVAATKRAMYAALDASESQIADTENLCERLSTEKDALFEQYQEGALTREELKDALNALNEIEKEQLEAIMDDVQFEIILIHKAIMLRWRRIDLRRHRDSLSGEYNVGDGGPMFGTTDRNRG